MKLIVFCLLFITSLGYSQAINLELLKEQYKERTIDSLFVKDVISNTTQLQNTGNYNEALKIINWLEPKINKEVAPKLYAKSLFEKGNVLTELGQYNDALEASKKSLKIYQSVKDSIEVASTYNLIGNVFYRLNEIDSTLLYYNKSYDLKTRINTDPWLLAISSYNLALVYNRQSRYDEAIESHFSAIDWYNKSSSKVVFLPSAYSSIAILYANKRDFVKAKEYSSLALTEGLNHYDPNSKRLMVIYNHNAHIHNALGEEEKAKPFILKSLKISEKVFGENHFWTTTIYGGLAKTYLDLKKADSAKWALNRAISRGKKSEEDFDFGNIYLIESEIFSAENKPDSALNSLNKSQESYEKVYGKNHWLLANTWLHKAKIYQKTNDPKKAMEAIENVFKRANYKVSDLTQLNAPFITLETLAIQFQYIDDAYKMKLIDEQINLIQHIKKFYQTQEAKLFFINTTTTILKENIAYCYQQYSKTKDEVFIEKAFELIQLQTNSILAEEVQIASKYLSSPEETRAFSEIKNLNQDWEKIKQELEDKISDETINKAHIDSLTIHKVNVMRQLDEAIVTLESFNKGTSRQLQLESIKNVQNHLNETAQLLQYFVGENHIYVISITSSEKTFLKLESKERIQQLIANLRQNIIQQKSLEETSTSLYNALISPVLSSSKQQLNILPDSFLGYIPFELLKNDKDEFLTESLAISYHFSVSLINLRQDELSLSNYWSGFGCQYDDESDLPQSIKEIEDIHTIVGGNTYLNAQGTTDNFFQQAKETDVLHVALHGNINQEDALYSELVFCDKAVMASQIYNERIQSNLVVLSACDTGYGNLESGEGIMSLSRAFTFSGAKSTITSLWQVPDKETAKIMSLFYEELNQGQSKIKALQNAKLNYLKTTDDATLRHPFYWSGFVLSGDVSALKANSNYGLYILIGCALILLIFMLWRKLKS